MSELNIPETWASAKFGEIFEVRRGASPRPVGDPKYFGDGKVGWLRIADVTREGKVILKTKDTLTEEGVKKSVFIKPGELVLSNSGTVGLPCFAGIPLCVHDGFLAFPNPPEEVYSEYLYWFFLNFRTEIQKFAKVGTQANLNTEIMRGIDFVLPPYKEQERIVQKIESCFEKIDATEQSLTKVETLLEKYRESLLAKAFRGELIPQNESDEPASVLLEKIRAEREKSAPAKKKKVQAFAPITDDEKPFDIPESWEWVSLGDLGVWSGGGTPSKQNREFWENGTVPWVSPKDMKSDVISGSRDKITQIALEERKISLLPVGTILFVTRSGILRHSLPVAWNDVEITINQDIKALILDGMVTTEYLFLCLRAFEKTILENCTKKGATVESVEFEKLKKFPIPIAPLKEQNRIIEKLHEALSSVEGSVENNKTLSKTLIPLKNSILNNAFEGRLVEQIESEGTGQELLEQILKAKAEEEPKKKVAKKKVAKKAAKKKLQKRNRIEK